MRLRDRGCLSDAQAASVAAGQEKMHQQMAALRVWEDEKAFPYYSQFPEGSFGEWFRLTERGEFTDNIGNYIVKCPKQAVDESWTREQLATWLNSHVEEFGGEE